MEDLCNLVDEKNKIVELAKHNYDTHDKLKKMIDIIDQVENSLESKISLHIKNMAELDMCIQENINLFRSICSNLV